jgi:hypothetical protein
VREGERERGERQDIKGFRASGGITSRRITILSPRFDVPMKDDGTLLICYRVFPSMKTEKETTRRREDVGWISSLSAVRLAVSAKRKNKGRDWRRNKMHKNLQNKCSI